jgi:type I restriction enzyme S subunit
MINDYKITVFGAIPKHWQIVEVNDITKEHKQGYYTKDDYVENGIRLARITDLNNPIVDYTDMPKLKISDSDFQSYKIEKNDFLFARSGAIGRYGIVEKNEFPAIFASYLIRFRFNSDIVNRFFGYFFESNLCSKQLKGISQGNANININAENIKSLKFPRPPLSEQQRIAEILSTVDAKIEIIDQQISETQELKKGLMQQLLTKGIGHTEFKDSVLGKIPKSWEVLKVGDTCSLKGGFAFKSSDSCEHGIRWVKIANVGVNKIKWNDESFLPHGFEIQHRDFVLNEGDIILAMTRPILNGKLKIARISKFDSGSLLNQRVGRILENNNLNKDFAYQVFNSFLFISAMEKELVGTDPPNISSSMFEELNIALPPLKEQVEIAEILTSYDQKLEVLSEKKTTYQELKQGLMQQLLTGKMRV